MKNVHKDQVILLKLPDEKLPNEYPTTGCCECKPELKLASLDSTNILHNDITGIAHKNQLPTDFCEFKIYKGNDLLPNNGVDYPNGFPHDPNVNAFIYNWKYYLINHGVGCYRIEKVFTIGGIEFTEDYSEYQLKEYTPESAKKTVRALVQFGFESLWEDEVINYADSGFEDSYRFRGYFSAWQPNTISNSDFSTDNTNRTSSIKSRETYELEHYMASECHFKRLHKIAMHTAVWRMSDHNPSNPMQSNVITECILEKEDAEQLDYTPGSRIATVKIRLQKRQANEISLFSGSIQLVQGATWLLPTVNGGGGTCDDANYLVEYENGTPIESGTIPSGGSATIQVPNPIICDDGEIEIYDTDSNLLDTVTIPSGSTESTTIGNSTAVLKDTGGNTLSTTPILAEGSEDIVAPDGTVNIVDSNGDPIGSQIVVSGGAETFEVVGLPCPIIPTRALTYLVNSGADGTFEIGIGSGAIFYSVLTEDGQYFSGQTGNLIITFPEINTNYFIEIRGLFPRPNFFFTGATNRAKLLQIIQKGDIFLDSFNGQSYRDCINLSNIIPHDYTLDGVENINYIFQNTNTSGNLPTGMTLSSVKTAYAAFRESNLSGIANLDIPNATDIRSTFRGTLFEELHIQNMGNVAMVDVNTFRISTLKKLTCDGLTKGFSIRFSPLLVGTEIDNLFTSLADISGGSTEIIELTTAQNTSGINTSIATLKGWTITVV